MAVTEEEMESGSFLVKLPYLGAVIKETLRLYPAVRSIPGRVTTRKIKLKSNGLEVPAGVALTSPSWVTARMVSVWGPDAREFNPSRFYRRSYDTKTGASTSPENEQKHCFHFQNGEVFADTRPNPSAKHGVLAIEWPPDVRATRRYRFRFRRFRFHRASRAFVSARTC